MTLDGGYAPPTGVDLGLGSDSGSGVDTTGLPNFSPPSSGGAATPADLGLNSSPSSMSDAGKTSIDLTGTNTLGSIGDAIGNLGKFAGGAVGGLAGAIGGVGFGNGRNIGALGDVPGNVLGAAGSIPLPNASNGPDAHLGDVPDEVMKLLQLGEQGVERTVAGQRVEAAQHGGNGQSLLGQGLESILGYFNPAINAQNIAAHLTGQQDSQALPPDLQARLNAGAPVSQIADELVQRGQGFSSNRLANINAQLVYDPMNLIGGALGKGVELAHDAGDAVKVGESGSALQNIVGHGYNTAASGLNQAGSAAVHAIAGPTTDAFAKMYGAGTYTGLKDAIGSHLPAAAQNFDRGLGVGKGNRDLSLIQKFFQSDIVKGLPTPAADAFNKAVASGDPGRISDAVANGLSLMKDSGSLSMRTRADIEKAAQNLLLGVARDPAMSADDIARMPARLQALGLSPEQAQKVIDSVGEKAAPYIREFAWGHSADLTAEAKARYALRTSLEGDTIKPGEEAASQAANAAAVGSQAEPGTGGATRAVESAAQHRFNADEVLGSTQAGLQRIEPYANPAARRAAFDEAMTPTEGSAALQPQAAQPLDYSRVTPLGPQTLSVDDAKALLDPNLTKDALDQAVNTKEILWDKFGGTKYTAADVQAYVKNILATLPTELHAPTGPGNALEPEFTGLRQQLDQLGYRLGLAPESSVTTFRNPSTGEDEVFNNIFAHVTSDAAPFTVRNRVGQVFDRLFGSNLDRQITVRAENDFAGAINKKAGVATGAGHAIFRDLMDAYRQTGRTTPTFRAFLNDPETYAVRNAFEKAGVSYKDLQAKGFNVRYELMNALRGHFWDVGASQYLTGTLKAQPYIGRLLTNVTDGIYPLAKFTANPLFQTQIRAEDLFFNPMRGIDPFASVTTDELKLYHDLGGYLGRDVMAEAYGGGMAAGNKVADDMALQAAADNGTAAAQSLQKAPLDWKSRQMVLQNLTENPQRTVDILRTQSPSTYRAWVDTYGTTDPKALLDSFLSERMGISFDRNVARGIPDVVKSDMMSTADQQTIWEAMRYAWQKGNEQAYATHFFGQDRSWVNRTLNHPYLGLYPASYMWGKVVPEFARFMLAKPMGLNAPLTGLAAVQQVQKQWLATLATEPKVGAFMKANPNLIYLATMLTPAWNTAPVNAPAYARHIEQAAATGGFQGNPGKVLTTQGQDLASYLLLRPYTDTGSAVGEGLNDINRLIQSLNSPSNSLQSSLPQNLSAAGALYDNNVTTPSSQP